MRTCVTLAAICAFVGAATAQTEGQWFIEIADPILLPGSPSTIFTVSVEPSASDYAVAGANWSMHADQGTWSDNTALLAQPGQNPGEIAGSSVTGISIGQLAMFGFVPTPRRIAVWEATFTADFPYTVINFWTETSRFEVYPVDPISVPPPRTEPRGVIEGRAQIIIPTPGGLALLGLGGLVASRRR